MTDKHVNPGGYTPPGTPKGAALARLTDTQRLELLAVAGDLGLPQEDPLWLYLSLAVEARATGRQGIELAEKALTVNGQTMTALQTIEDMLLHADEIGARIAQATIKATIQNFSTEAAKALARTLAGSIHEEMETAMRSHRSVNVIVSLGVASLACALSLVIGVSFGHAGWSLSYLIPTIDDAPGGVVALGSAAVATIGGFASWFLLRRPR